MTEEVCRMTNRHESFAVTISLRIRWRYIMKKLLKLPLRITALSLIAILLVFQLISSIIVELFPIVTSLFVMIFFLGSVAGWIVNAPSDLTL